MEEAQTLASKRVEAVGDEDAGIRRVACGPLRS
jgi:hypothetical protein